MNVVSRIGLTVVSAFVIVWLALAYHAVDLAQHGAAEPGDLKQVESAFHDARDYSPDVPLAVEEGYLYMSTGEMAKALPLLKEAVRQEPNNYFALKLIAAAAVDEDPELAERAEQRLEEVDPKGSN